MIKRIENFELFKAEEIKVREGASVNTKNGRKKTLLLYQDARAAMNRLDARFGEYGWQREHKDVHGVTYCGVSLWDDDKKCWVTKWDAGEPSKTAKEKGEASDSFKRACVNFGIGRELYTAPFIAVDENVNTQALKVSHIAYTDDRKICALTISDYYGNVVYQMGQKNAAAPAKTAQAPKPATPTQAEKPQTKSEQELEELYGTLDLQELAEYNDYCRQVKEAQSRADIVTIYNRARDARWAALLWQFAFGIIKEKGWTNG